MAAIEPGNARVAFNCTHDSHEVAGGETLRAVYLTDGEEMSCTTHFREAINTKLVALDVLFRRVGDPIEYLEYELKEKNLTVFCDAIVEKTKRLVDGIEITKLEKDANGGLQISEVRKFPLLERHTDVNGEVFYTKNRLAIRLLRTFTDAQQ